MPKSDAYILKHELLNKIKEEWEEKWLANHGSSIENVRSQNAFLDDLLDDIEITLKRNIGLEEAASMLISKTSLWRLLRSQENNYFQEKTRDTIAYYLGYDGWGEFAEIRLPELEHSITNLPENEELPSRQPSPSHLPASTPYRLLSRGLSPQLKRIFYGGAVVIVIAFIAYAFIKNKTVNPENITFDILYTDKATPASVEIEYDLSKVDYEKASLFIDNETLFYYNPEDYEYRLRKEKGGETLQFFTPGIKRISLKVDDVFVKHNLALIGTGNDWYSCARVKARGIPAPLGNDFAREWYGIKGQVSNTAENFITSPDIWKAYQAQRVANKSIDYLTFPKERLTFPNESYSRVAFLKAKEFGVDIDSLSLSFRARRDSIPAEDCLSFMLQLFDQDLKMFEFYSSGVCIVDGNVSIGYYQYFQGEDEHTTDEWSTYFKVKELNKFLEDFRWHKIEIVFKNNILKIFIDNVEKLNISYKSTYRNLNEVWFVFEGNGSIDDVLVKNSHTGQTIFSDDFSF